MDLSENLYHESQFYRGLQNKDSAYDKVVSHTHNHFSNLLAFEKLKSRGSEETKVNLT